MDKRFGSRRRYVLPLFSLFCGLGATALATFLINENLHFKNQQRFKDAIAQVDQTLTSHIGSYISLLRGFAGLFAANQSVSLEQFRKFHERLEIGKDYPGIQGFGYTVRVPPEQLDELVTVMRADGWTNFTVTPQGQRPEYHSIVFLEPLDARNRRAIGFDMFSDPTRRRAMELARDNGAPVFSRKVRLIQEFPGPEVQPGFLLYVPVYAGGTIPPTPSERRAQLQGFVYCPFRAGDLFTGILRSLVPGLAFAVWDGVEPDAEALLYQSHPDFQLARASRTDLHIPGATWTLGVSELPGYHAGHGGKLLWFVSVLGVFASVLLCYLTYHEGKARALSEVTADELSNQREWLAITLSSIGDGVISTDQYGRVQFMNIIAEELTGWKLEETKDKPLREYFPIRDEHTGAELLNPADTVLSTGHAIKFTQPTLLTARDGTERCIDDSAAPIRDRHGEMIGAVLVFRDTTEQLRYERRSTAQHAVTRILAEFPSLPEAGEQVLKALCQSLRFDFGIIWLFNKQSGEAEAVNFWHPPGENFDRFEQACRSFRPSRGMGLPGMVWEHQKAEWISDFSNDSRFPRAADARLLDLKTAFAFPILIDGQVFGALEVFSHEQTPPDSELLNVAQGIGTQIGQFVQRKRAEHALAQSEELHRAISETAADGIIVIDEKSRVVSVNSAIERIFGHSREEMMGASLKKIMPQRMHAAHEQALQRFIATGQKRINWTGMELPGLHRDGHEIPLEISFGVARLGNAYLFTGLMRDITKRKEAERQLRESEERFALLVRRAEEYAIITTDRDGLISTWNPGAESIFGYSDGEVLGRGLEIFYADEDHDLAARQMATAEAEGQVVDERWQVRKDNSRFWAAATLVCLRSEDGTVRGFALILRDITERKEAEEAIHRLNQELETRVQRRTAALQESKEQMEAFTYTVAHDLRAPLRAMQGFAHAIVEDYQNRLDSEAIEYLRRIMASSHRMDELIQDLLAYSQLSRSDLASQPVAVREVVENALQNHEAEIKKRNAEIQLSLDPLFVRAHPGTFENAIGNLLTNALKFVHPGVTPKIQIRAFVRDGNVRISFQDNGIGIAEEHRERIFRVFERLHGPDAFPGTGIGLAIVKKGIERMGGTVGLGSTLGQGSLFWIELPREDPET